MANKLVRAFIAVGVTALIWLLPVPIGLKPQAWHLFAIFAGTILAFMLQPLPMGAIAFISLGFTALTGVLKTGEVLSPFSAPVIWLIASAFMFSRGFIKTGLGRRVAYLLIRAIGDSTLKLSYAMVLSTLVIAPATPSSTARAGGIIFPIVKSLSEAFDSEPGPTAKKLGSFLMLSAYHGNSITSAMFMTAMAANALIAKLAFDTLGIEITWGLWALAAVVPGVISLALVPYLLYKIYPPELTKTPEAKEIATEALAKMGPASKGEKIVFGVFILALVLWATGNITKLDATLVALVCVGLMLITKVLEWKDIIEEKGAWDSFVWMGTLIGLADFLNKTGFIPWLAKLISANLGGMTWMYAFIAIVLVYIYSHYIFASLTAHITAMYAPFALVAVAAGTPKYLIALALGYWSSLMAGLTHYAAGEAPVYFGSGYIEQEAWWRLGFIISVVNLVVWVGIGGAWWKILGLW